MRLKRFLLPFLAVVFCAALSLSALAADITKDVDITYENIRGARLVDGKIDTSSAGENVKITIESDTPLGGVWLRYSATPVGGLLNGDTKIAENGFWSEFIPLCGNSAVLTFEEVTLCEINIYSEGELPSEVQRFEVAQNETDIMLFSAHSDDDQLFFAGLVPYYVARGNADVKVCFFTTSYQDISRVQELLAGLWHCGLRVYPIIFPMPDDYSESYNRASRLLANSGYLAEDVTKLVRNVLNTYCPSVVVLHDFEGEYGHGMHRLSAKAVADTIENAGENDFVPSKVYVHLLAQNEIKLPIDEPLDAFSGKSAFNISQEAFQFHKSQHWTWFYDWIYGENKEIHSASQIRNYNPADYGLYLTQVGSDTTNDMLENIETHKDRRARLAREEAEKEALAKAEAEAAQTEAVTTYIFEETDVEVKQTKGISMRFLVLPIIIVLLLAITIFVVWVIEERPFIRISPEDFDNEQ